MRHRRCTFEEDLFSTWTHAWDFLIAILLVSYKFFEPRTKPLSTFPPKSTTQRILKNPQADLGFLSTSPSLNPGRQVQDGSLLVDEKMLEEKFLDEEETAWCFRLVLDGFSGSLDGFQVIFRWF